MGGDNAVQRVRLKLAVAFLTIKRHDFIKWHATNGFYFPVKFDKWQIQPRSDGATQCRLARTAQSDKTDPLRPVPQPTAA